MTTHHRSIVVAVIGVISGTIATYSATPTQPATTKAPAAANPALDPVWRRLIVMPQKAMPFPVMRFETNADGSYSKVGATQLASGNFKYAFEEIGGGKYRIAVGKTLNKGAWVWEVDEKDTLLELAKADPKIMEAIRKCAPEGGYTPESFLQRFGEKEQYRVSIGASRYVMPDMSLDEMLKLIVARDPRTQSLMDATLTWHPTTICPWGVWETPSPIAHQRPANVERVSIHEIAKELLATKLAPDAEISIRDEVERLGVKHRRQIGDTCTIYSGYHLLDYYMKKGDIRPLSFEEFKPAMQSISGTWLLGKIAAREPGTKIRVRHLNSFATIQNSVNPQLCERIRDRFIQHELEAGRPIWLSLGFHQVMLVGIKPTNQPNMAIKTITALDSTGFGDKDKGYSHWSRLEVSELLSIEFVKQATQRTTHTP